MALHPTLANIKRNLPSVSKSLGFSARVTSGFRTRAAQTKLYKRYLAGLQPYPVAPPGTSDHERGLALDVVSTDPAKLVELLTAAGLSWAGPADPVHFVLKNALGAPQRPKVEPVNTNVYLSSIKAAGEQYVSFLKPAPLQFIDFLSDPVGTIKKNIGTAASVFLSFL